MEVVFGAFSLVAIERGVYGYKASSRDSKVRVAIESSFNAIETRDADLSIYAILKLLIIFFHGGALGMYLGLCPRYCFLLEVLIWVQID